MRKILLLASFCFCFTAFAQGAKKFVLFEHFTQTNCGPCADQNPTFKNGILDNNSGRIHHIAYHTNFPNPNNDPMHLYAEQDALDRQSYYTVQGVPTMIAEGADNGSPASISQTFVDDTTLDTSPLEVIVSESEASGVRSVTVSVNTVAEYNGGSNLALRVAIVEADVTYSSSPGNNGETYFPNAFRGFLNSSAGESFTPSAMGEGQTFEYSYTVDTENTVPENVYFIAWVQDETTKSIINSGGSQDPDWFARTNDQSFKKGTAFEFSTFTTELVNNGSAGDFEIILEAPGNNWNSTFLLNGQTYDANALYTVNLPENSVTQALINVLVGSDPDIGTYQLKMQKVGSDFAQNYSSFNLISGVSDLIINNASTGSGTSNTDIWDGTYYIGGLNAAGNTKVAATSFSTFNRGYESGVLNNIKKLYYNIGWTFPAMENRTVANLGDFLDNGGRLLISGQDVAWDTYDTASGAANGTPETRAFMTNYMGVGYVDDGGVANQSITPISSDEVFGAMGSSNIASVYTEGGDYYYPDVISVASSTASSYMNYNGDASLVCGIKNDNGTYKTVYLGIGIEMIGDEAVRNEFMQITMDWFNEGIPAVAGFVYDLNDNSNAITVSETSQNATAWLWNYGDGTTTSGQNPEPHIYENSGEYELCLTVTNDNGQTDTYCQTIVVETTVGIQDLVEEFGMAIYPNPVNTLATIEFGNVDEKSVLNVIDATGKIILIKNIEAGTPQVTLNASELVNGTYWCQLSNNGTIIAAKKLLVTH